MKIEHWHSQSKYPHEVLVYSNLLGSCKGNEGNNHDPRIQHCDTRKGNSDIKWNPANSDHHIEDRIRYLADGIIFSEDEEFNQQINEVLNLNVSFLVTSRKYVLDSFRESLGNKGLTPQQWENLLLDWNGESHSGDLNEYCQIVVLWLRKKRNRG